MLVRGGCTQVSLTNHKTPYSFRLQSSISNQHKRRTHKHKSVKTKIYHGASSVSHHKNVLKASSEYMPSTILYRHDIEGTRVPVSERQKTIQYHQPSPIYMLNTRILKYHQPSPIYMFNTRILKYHPELPQGFQFWEAFPTTLYLQVNLATLIRTNERRIQKYAHLSMCCMMPTRPAFRPREIMQTFPISNLMFSMGLPVSRSTLIVSFTCRTNQTLAV